MCCKSLDVNALIPLDSSIVIESWKSVNNSGLIQEANRIITCLYIIIDAVLEQRCFLQSDRDYLKKNKDVLKTDKMNELIEKEFFNFSNKLIDLLYNEKFDIVNEQYLLFREY